NGLPPQFAMGEQYGVFLTPYGLVNNYWAPNYWNNNFTNTKKVMSAYAMARFDGDLFGIRVRGNAGVRYEATTQKIDALDCRNCLAGLSLLPL
ncbi:hypothetical protein GY655_26540, partial [Escherichia coli]|nr:hypothetical protein [Escherichia coli]